MKVFNYNIVALAYQQISKQPSMQDINDLNIDFNTTSVEDTIKAIETYSAMLSTFNISQYIKYFKNLNVSSPILMELYEAYDDGFALMDYVGNHIHFINVKNVDNVVRHGVKFNLSDEASKEITSNHYIVSYVPVNYDLLASEFAWLLSMNGDGFEFDLGEKTFLTNMLDGSDKIYGFKVTDADNNEVEVDNGGSGFPLTDMDNEDIDFLFTRVLGEPSIYDNLITKIMFG